MTDDTLTLPDLALLWYGEDTPKTRAAAARHALRRSLGIIEPTPRGPIRRVSRSEAEANRPGPRGFQAGNRAQRRKKDD